MTQVAERYLRLGLVPTRTAVTVDLQNLTEILSLLFDYFIFRQTLYG